MKIFHFLASYGLACVLLFLLLLLVLFGTLEQVNNGLYAVQEKYFNSFLVTDLHIGSSVIPVLLPGAYPLMVLLFLNLVCGAIIRAPKNWRQPGMLIAHGGIIFLVLASFVTAEMSYSGHMTLFERDTSNYFDDYYLWEVGITELDTPETARTFTIVHDQLADLAPGQSRIYKHAELPFELELSNWLPNANPRQQAPMLNETGIDGVVMQSIPLDKEAERNIAGVTAKVTPSGGEPKSSYLWGASAGPWVAEAGGKQYGISLRHKRYPVPFSITLDKFIRDLHPRTMMAANFESEVTMTEATGARKVNIRMNEPLREGGYTFFQASWGPENARPGEPLFSTFAVVNNPADQWPKYACYVIGIGMLIHFSQKLAGYIRAQNRRRSA
jgi:hypothetical protein